MTGCCVTATNVTPPGAASATVTSCAWLGPLFRTRTVYATSASPFTSCTCGVASFTTCTSMNSSVATAGGGGVTQLPWPSFTIPAGTVAWLPAMFGQTSVGGVVPHPT